MRSDDSDALRQVSNEFAVAYDSGSYKYNGTASIPTKINA